MSDTSYPVFQHYGTNAERVAFTPTPGGGQPIYLWFETDTGETWLYDTSWHQITSGFPGKVVQVVNVETGAVATGTTQMPFDDSKPQKTEGDEYMTLAITPLSATNLLYIDVQGFWTTTTTPWLSVALFQDTASDALAATSRFVHLATTGGDYAFRHKMTAGTTSATTFKVRAGPSNAATVTFNGQSAGRIFGGVMSSSITITEVVP